MALALYRKYRPATFADVVGQEHVTEPLRTALAAGRINHAYLFSGPRGCGKTSSARILARSLNCEQGPTPDPCGVCASCVALAPEGPGSLDVVELDAASHGGVDDTRELRDRAFYVPAESRYRVFIIDEAHMVTSQGFNALLKIVEEPPEHLVFVFATTEPEKVLPTIRSRTHHYPFRLIPPATLRALLEKLCGEEGVAVEPAVYPLVVRAGAGSARDSLSVMDQLLAGSGPEGVTYAHAVALLGVTDAALLDEMVDALAASDGASVFGAVDRVAEAGHDPRRFGVDLLQRLRDLVILQAVPDAASKGLIDAPEDQLAAMVAQADRLPTATLTRFAEILHTGLTDMRGTTSPRLVLELLCARMLLPAASLSDGALLQRLERVERRLEIAGGHGGDGASGGPAPSRPGTGGGDDTAGLSASATSADRGAAGRTRAPAATVPAATPPAGRQAREAPARSTATGGRPAATASVGTAGDALGLPAPPVLSTDRPAATAAAAVAGSSDAAEPDAAEPDPGEPGTGRPETSPPGPGRRDAPPPGAGRSADPNQDAAAPAPARAGVDVTDVRRVWTEILAAAKRQRRTTQVLLESATVAGVAGGGSGGTLLLTMPSPALARRVTETGNTDVLRAALREVLGVDWRIRCDAGSGNDPASAPGSGAAAGPRQATPTGAEAATTRPAAESAAVRAPAEPPADADDEIDPYDEIDPDTLPAAVQDPEQVAMELLADRLGARRIDQQR